MPSGTSVTVERYLNTGGNPSCGYVDGQVLQPNFVKNAHLWVSNPEISVSVQDLYRSLE
ncbi:MAG: hypothetical protein ABI822_05935 [Bryobacteraceae bacterium]